MTSPSAQSASLTGGAMAGKTPAPALVVLAGWLVPGGGQYLLGRKPRATVFFFAVTLTYLAGMALADFGNVSLERHTYYFLAHVFNGGETILAWLLTMGVVEDHVPTHFGIHTGDIGILYTAVASLLNLIVIMDAYGIAAGVSPAPAPEEQAEEQAEEPAEGATP
jgi:hypothetical protein